MPFLRSVARADFVRALCAGLNLLISVILVVTAGRSAAGDNGAETPQQPMPATAWVTGTVVSRHDVQLTAAVAGQLVSVKAPGSRLAENAVVARIDPTFIKLKLEECKTQLESDRARLEFLRNEIARNKDRAREDQTIQLQLNELRAEREVARNELQVSRQRLKQTREDLYHHTIRSPFAGIIVERVMRRGERVAIGDAVVNIVDSRSLEVQVKVPQETVDFIREGELLTIVVNGREVTVPVRVSAAAGDVHSRMLDVRLGLAEGDWSPGQTVRMALPAMRVQ